MIMGKEVILSGSVQQFIDLLVRIMIRHFHRHRAASPMYSIFRTKKKKDYSLIHYLNIMSFF